MNASPSHRPQGQLANTQSATEAGSLHSSMRFMRVDSKLQTTLAGTWSIIEPHLPEILNRFYEHAVSEPRLAALVGNQASRLKGAQSEHWKRLFTGRFDEKYLESVRTIGKTHNRIGLEPVWYMGGYLLIMNAITEILTRHFRFSPQKAAAAISAANSAIMLDMNLALGVYQEAYAAQAEENKREGMRTIADSFESEMGGIITSIGQSATSLNTQSTSLTSSAGQTLDQAASATNASQEASTNVQTVAAASEELAASILEISRQTAQTKTVSQEAADDVTRSKSKVAEMTAYAQKIGTVIDLISEIAAQTNLLALNATIEAARAGEAGKGFAVVASEVKTLASQTARATDEIGAIVRSIQAATQETVTSIDKIGQTIGSMTEITSAVAAAIEEQRAATQEISRSVQVAAHGTEVATQAMVGVRDSANASGSAAEHVLKASVQLSEMSARLSQNIGTFLKRARAG